MCCGGTVEIYIEPIMKKNRLYIFGAGHTGQALAKQAVNFDFEVVLIDDRKEYLDQCSIEDVSKMHLDFRQALAVLPFNLNTYICIMTYNHAIDRDILSFCVRKEFAYLGMIGSKRKIALTKKMFLEAGHVNEEEINKVDMPMGIDILAESPEEIAVSIMAKLIMVRNKKIA
jgi:xanthine dehydrogenase accessory factor